MIHEIDNAITYFMENYNREINIEEYASSRGMSQTVKKVSISWLFLI
jgi:AraC family transcriptional regulator of arabinose operon